MSYLDFKKKRNWRLTYTFILRSGAKVRFKARKISFEYKKETAEISAFKVEGLRGKFPMHCIPTEIVAIVES
jgi:hypothetical protein